MVVFDAVAFNLGVNALLELEVSQVIRSLNQLPFVFYMFISLDEALFNLFLDSKMQDGPFDLRLLLNHQISKHIVVFLQGLHLFNCILLAGCIIDILEVHLYLNIDIKLTLIIVLLKLIGVKHGFLFVLELRYEFKAAFVHPIPIQIGHIRLSESRWLVVISVILIHYCAAAIGVKHLHR